MKTILPVATLAVTLIFSCQTVHADCDFLKPHCSDNQSCGSCAPVWLCCQGQPKSVTKTKHCYDVECEYVCIPPVRLPRCCRFLQDRSCDADSCGDSCGDDCGEDCATCAAPGLLQRVCARFTDCRIRKVHRMVKQEQDVEECEWEWKVVRMAPPGSGKCCDDSCVPPASCCAPCAELTAGSW